MHAAPQEVIRRQDPRDASDPLGPLGVVGPPAAPSVSTEGLRPGERGCPNTPAEWAVLRYPENLTLPSLSYFIAAPTLTYQVSPWTYIVSCSSGQSLRGVDRFPDKSLQVRHGFIQSRDQSVMGNSFA